MRTQLYPALNGSTLRSLALPLPEEIALAGEVGFHGYEIWVRDLEVFLSTGGKTSHIREAAKTAGIRLINGIAFFTWSDRNRLRRKEGLNQARREIALLAEIGCSAVAAPPTGDMHGLSSAEIGEHFAELHALAANEGVEALLEFWGRNNTLGTVTAAVQVLDASGVEGGRALIDLYHMYTGGSDIDSISALGGSRIGLVHLNDYPRKPGVNEISDAERCFPGEGVAPVTNLIGKLIELDYKGFLSLEIFPRLPVKSTPMLQAERAFDSIHRYLLRI